MFNAPPFKARKTGMLCCKSPIQDLVDGKTNMLLNSTISKERPKPNYHFHLMLLGNTLVKDQDNDLLAVFFFHLTIVIPDRITKFSLLIVEK